MYFWKYILAKKAGLSQQKCNTALYGLPVLPIAEAFEKTVTGNQISVTDALAKPAVSLKVKFNPIQDLHGYDNPWPAGGGKNKINIPDTVLSSNTYLFNGSISLPSGSYVLSITKDDGASSVGNVSLAAVMSNGDNATVLSSVSGNRFALSITASESIVSMRFYVVAGTYSKAMLESGSTATAYAPYSNICPISGWDEVSVNHSATSSDAPTEYEVEFTSQGTVYGGTVDIVSGELTVTWTILSNPQNLHWITNSSQGMKNFQTDRGTVSKKSGSNNWKCSRYSNGFIGTDKSEGIFIFDSGEVCIRDYRYWEHGGTSAEEAAFKASLADVTIAYELATPLTYQLTAQQVQMLLGNNYLETEDGTITLTYMAGK